MVTLEQLARARASEDPEVQLWVRRMDEANQAITAVLIELGEAREAFACASSRVADLVG